MCSAVVHIKDSELRISLIEVLRQMWGLRRFRRQSCGRGSLSLAPRRVMRRWSCCLIRWRYDFRKQLKWEVWPAHHNAGRAALISSSLLDTGVFTTCFPAVIQPWPGPVGLPHILQFKYKTPSSAINFWQHRQIRGPEVALWMGLVLLLPGPGRSVSPYAATVKGTRLVTMWKSSNLKIG